MSAEKLKLPYSPDEIAGILSVFLKYQNNDTSKADMINAEQAALEGGSERIRTNMMMTEFCFIEFSLHKRWLALQHYIYYIYRHYISPKPFNNIETLPPLVRKAITQMFDMLLEMDPPQMVFRLVSLIRDYTILVLNHVENIHNYDAPTYLYTLMAYYSALCTAANICSHLFPDFECVTMARFNCNWVGVNKSIFYQHVYLSPNVQEKIPLFKKLLKENLPSHKGLLETYVYFEKDMHALDIKWSDIQKRITDPSELTPGDDPEKPTWIWRMYLAQKNIFESYIWLDRKMKEIATQDMTILDAHIFAWVAHKSSIPKSLIDSKGCCLCEDCLSAEFRNNSIETALAKTFRAETPGSSIVSCYICYELVVLNTLIKHIMAKHSISSDHGKHHICPLPFRKKPPQKGSPKDTPKGPPKKPDLNSFDNVKDLNEYIRRSILELIDDAKSSESNVSRNGAIILAIKELFSTPPSDSASGSEDRKPPTRSIFLSDDEDDDSWKDEVILGLDINSPLFKKAETEATEEESSDEDTKIFLEQIQNLIYHRDCENVDARKKRKPKSKAKNTQTDNANIDVGTSTVPIVKKSNLSNANHENLVASTRKANISNDEKSAPPLKKDTASNTSNENLAASIESDSFRKPQQKEQATNIDPNVLEFFKTANVNNQNSTPSPPKTSDTCLGHSCGHKCTHDDDVKKSNAMDSCDHHRDSNKCDCTYCEVFGSALHPNTQKTSETRDRLRTRLNQRKEREHENMEIGIPQTDATSKIGGNCTIKISKNSKMALPNGQTINVTAKVLKAVPTEPPRVPELHHPVPPPGNTKIVHVAVEVKKSAANNDESLVTDNCSGHHSSMSSSTSSILSESGDCRDINDLLNYIEGTKTVDKAAIAYKKAAKKARQRLKKAQEKEEKERIELERQKLKEEARLREQKLREEERRKAEALIEKQKKIKKDDKILLRQEVKKGVKKKGCKPESAVQVPATTKIAGSSKLIEETIPAMVTIKRASEGNNSQATVTITLKGSTPDTDKLLFTLVNGNEDGIKENTTVPNKAKGKTNVSNKSAQPTTTKVVTENVKTAKKKKEKENVTITKPMKVTIAVDKNNAPKKEASAKKTVKMDTFASHQLQKAFNSNKDSDISSPKLQNNAKEEISLPMLNLPPGITITKIDGPPSTGNCKYSNSNNSHHSNHNQTQNTSVPATKSGVIVVDTEKLIQQSIAASINKRDKKMSKKKRDLKTPPAKAPECTKLPEPPTMITLKNPIFEAQQNNKLPDKSSFDFPSSQQASFFKGENGMVTIRSPRLQNPFETGAPVSSYFSDIQPTFTSDIAAPYVPMQQQSSFYESSNNPQVSQYNSHYHAHEFLAGLPGIEITKINKAAASDNEKKETVKPISTPSVPTNNVINDINTFNFDAEDWHYENVFKPRDNIEEDMDDEELELEEFKRFCHQSNPGSLKQNITDLNMGNLVFNKDISYA